MCGNKAPNIRKLGTSGNEWFISLAALSLTYPLGMKMKKSIEI